MLPRAPLPLAFAAVATPATLGGGDVQTGAPLRLDRVGSVSTCP